MALNAVKGVLIDLSGTILVGRNEVPGSVNALRRLRDAGIPVRFVTNTTKETKANLVGTMNSMGFAVNAREVFSSLAAARKLVDARSLRPLLLVHANARAEFDGVDTTDPTAVVIGLADEVFTYDQLNTAFRLLMEKPDVALIGIHKARYFKDADGRLSLGPGPFVEALEFATGKPAEVVGKPEPSFFQLALDDLGLTPAEAVMVGDDAADDIAGARRLGMRALLVRTGKYLAGAESSCTGAEPSAVVDDFAAAVHWILQQAKQQQEQEQEQQQQQQQEQ